MGLGIQVCVNTRISHRTMRSKTHFVLTMLTLHNTTRILTYQWKTFMRKLLLRQQTEFVLSEINVGCGYDIFEGYTNTVLLCTCHWRRFVVANNVEQFLASCLNHLKRKTSRDFSHHSLYKTAAEEELKNFRTSCPNIWRVSSTSRSEARSKTV